MNTPLLSCPLATTAELPAEAFGVEFGGRADYSYADWRGTGYLDAPDLLPARP